MNIIDFIHMCDVDIDCDVYFIHHMELMCNNTLQGLCVHVALLCMMREITHPNTSMRAIISCVHHVLMVVQSIHTHKRRLL